MCCRQTFVLCRTHAAVHLQIHHWNESAKYEMKNIVGISQWRMWWLPYLYDKTESSLQRIQRKTKIRYGSSILQRRLKHHSKDLNTQWRKRNSYQEESPRLCRSLSRSRSTLTLSSAVTSSPRPWVRSLCHWPRYLLPSVHTYSPYPSRLVVVRLSDYTPQLIADYNVIDRLPIAFKISRIPVSSRKYLQDKTTAWMC